MESRSQWKQKYDNVIRSAHVKVITVLAASVIYHARFNRPKKSCLFWGAVCPQHLCSLYVNGHWSLTTIHLQRNSTSIYSNASDHIYHTIYTHWMTGCTHVNLMMKRLFGQTGWFWSVNSFFWHAFCFCYVFICSEIFTSKFICYSKVRYINTNL